MFDRRGAAAVPMGSRAQRTAGSTTPARSTRTRMSGSASVRIAPGLSTCTAGLWTPARRIPPANTGVPAADRLRTTERARYHGLPMARPTSFGRDTGLQTRMLLTMFLLGLVYVVFIGVLFAAGA